MDTFEWTKITEPFVGSSFLFIVKLGDRNYISSQSRSSRRREVSYYLDIETESEEEVDTEVERLISKYYWKMLI